MTTALHSLAMIRINLRLVILDSIDVFALLIFLMFCLIWCSLCLINKVFCLLNLNYHFNMNKVGFLSSICIWFCGFNTEIFTP